MGNIFTIGKKALDHTAKAAKDPDHNPPNEWVSCPYGNKEVFISNTWSRQTGYRANTGDVQWGRIMDQCPDLSGCRWSDERNKKQPQGADGCSDGGVSTFGNVHGGHWICKIHDACYSMSARSKPSCDVQMLNNGQAHCRARFAGHRLSWARNSCMAAIMTAFTGLRYAPIGRNSWHANHFNKCLAGRSKHEPWAGNHWSWNSYEKSVAGRKYGRRRGDEVSLEAALGVDMADVFDSPETVEGEIDEDADDRFNEEDEAWIEMLEDDIDIYIRSYFSTHDDADHSKLHELVTDWESFVPFATQNAAERLLLHETSFDNKEASQELEMKRYEPDSNAEDIESSEISTGDDVESQSESSEMSPEDDVSESEEA